MRASAIGVVSVLLASCSLAVDTDGVQCNVDADCTEAGDDLTCNEGVCEVSDRWECVGGAPAASTTSAVSLRIPIEILNSGRTPPTLAAEACTPGLQAPVCRAAGRLEGEGALKELVVEDLALDDEGRVVEFIRLSAGPELPGNPCIGLTDEDLDDDGNPDLSACIATQIDDDDCSIPGAIGKAYCALGIIPVDYRPRRIERSDTRTTRTVQVMPAPVLSQIGESSNVAVDLQTKSIVLMEVRACDGEMAEGVSLRQESSEPRGNRFYFLQGGTEITSSATATDLTGLGGYVNLPQDSYRMQGLLGDLLIGSTEVRVEPGRITWSEVIAGEGL